MTIQDARPCPFCGGREMNLRSWVDGTAAQVSCKTCGSCGPFKANHRGATQDALTHWNVRLGPGKATVSEPSKV